MERGGKKLDKTVSPVVEKTRCKRFSTRTTRNTLAWGTVNIILALAIYCDITYGRIASVVLALSHPLFWYAEWGLVGLFFFNGVFDVLRYLRSTFSASPIVLTPRQKSLLGVKDSETGFRMARPRVQPPSGGVNNLVLSPSAFSTPHGSPLLPGGVSRRYTPPSRTPSPPPYTPYSPTNTSTSFQQHNSSSFLNQTHNSSLSFPRSGTTSPLNQSPLFRESFQETSGVRNRFNVSRSSPLATDDCLTDVRAFDQFLRDQTQKEYRTQLGSPESSPSSGPSFWNYNRSVIDYGPVLRKYQYQMACRDPQATTSRDNDPADPATYRGEEIWAKLDVHRDELDQWMENLRKWLSQTIFVRVSREIKNINKNLARIGSEDMKIGEVSISTLKQLAVTKAVHVPTLNAILPFLEVSANQEYLVKRIHELAQGGCIHDYKWNGGSDYKGKPWQESQPTDSEIVMHLLCSYMDSRLPPHPKYPDGKTFTSQVFVKTPDKPDFTKKDQSVIYQAKLNPPHYKVILSDDTWDLPRGRTNLLQAVLLFLHHIQTREHGMLGRVNLGLSGINILWVLEK